MTRTTRRLRPPPSRRFRDRERCFDLDAAFRRLPGESIPRDGHMQQTLCRYGGVTTAIFAFDAGAGLDRFRVDGESILHVIDGRVHVETDDATHELTPDCILLLDPDVAQSLTAVESSRVLIHFILDGTADEESAE